MMRFTPLSAGVATARRASAAVLCTVLVAACDTDRPVSPTTSSTVAEVPATASAAFVPRVSGALVIRTVDINLTTIGPAKFKMIGPNLVVSYFADNDANDAEPKFGTIWLKNVPVGNYSVCEIEAPPRYALPDWACHPTTVTAGATTGVEKFVHQHWLPWVSGTYITHLGAVVGGGSLTVKDSTGAPILVVADESALDYSKLQKAIQIMLPKEGKFSVCGLNPPAGYALSPELPPCKSVDAKYDKGYYVDAFVLNPATSALWSVKDGFGALVGPSSFSVSIPGVFLFNVVDNSTNDLDPKVGRLLAKFPSAGTYTLCQTQAPPGRWVAKPACRMVTIPAGASVNAGSFTNYEAQVPSQ